MTTKLDGPLKREVVIGGAPYTITIDPRGVKLVPKGKRKSYELEWESVISGDATLAMALTATLANALDFPAKPAPRKHNSKLRAGCPAT